MINSSISLVCAFIGEPAPIITWYRIDGSIYTEVNSTSKTLVANESFSIIESVVSIRNVRRSDHGRYKCRAVNQVGASERNVTLNVTCKRLLFCCRISNFIEFCPSTSMINLTRIPFASSNNCFTVTSRLDQCNSSTNERLTPTHRW